MTDAADASATTRNDILDVAEREFADKGLSGARVDEIAERTRSSKRMLYYHFGGKEGLYRAVLDRAYHRIREHENKLDIEHLAPDEALRRLCEFTFNYHQQNPELVRLVMNENIHRGETVRSLENARQANRSIIATLERLLERGRALGLFRAEPDAINLHMTISALCFYAVSNRHTFAANFNWDMESPEALATRSAIVGDTVLRWCLVGPEPPATPEKNT
jgi:AcrR family transcriptional regulator